MSEYDDGETEHLSAIHRWWRFELSNAGENPDVDQVYQKVWQRIEEAFGDPNLYRYLLDELKGEYLADASQYKTPFRMLSGGLTGRIIARRKMTVRNSNADMFEALTTHGRKLIIKFLGGGKPVNDSLRLADLLKEMRILEFHDKRVVRVYESGDMEIDGKVGPGIVMEFIDGQTLREFTEERLPKKPPHTLEEAAQLVWQVAVTLQKLYSYEDHPILHLDIKPDNIMIVPDEQEMFGYRIVMIDFGAAGTGTKAYRAPERPGTPDDVRMDIYSLGKLFLFLLTGSDPEGKDQDTLDYYLPEQSSNHLKALKAIIHKSLQESPENRYQTPGDLAQDISMWIRAKEVAIGGIQYSLGEKLRLLVRRCRRPDATQVDSGRLWSIPLVTIFTIGVATAIGYFVATNNGIDEYTALWSANAVYIPTAIICFGVALFITGFKNHVVNSLTWAVAGFIVIFFALRARTIVMPDEVSHIEAGMIATTQALLTGAMCYAVGVSHKLYVWIVFGLLVTTIGMLSPLITLQPWFNLSYDVLLQNVAQGLSAFGFAIAFLLAKDDEEKGKSAGLATT